MPTDPAAAEDAAASAPPRMLTSVRHRLMAAAAAATVLVAGYAARPAEPVAARLEETPGPLLQQAVEQRAPQTIFRALQRVGTSSLPYVARIEVRPGPLEVWSDIATAVAAVPPDERFGVIIGADEILAEGTGVAVGDEVTVTVGDGRQMNGTVTAHFRDRGLALVGARPSSPFTRPPLSAGVAPGDAVVAVGPGAEGPVVAPVFVAGATGGGILTATPVERFRGMGVFNEAGALVGIVAGAGEGTRILTVERALAPVPFRDPPAPALGLSLALAASPADGGERVVTVSALAPDGAAARLGLLEGDVLLGEDGQPVSGIEAARTMLSGAREADRPVRVLRGRRTLALRPPPPSDGAAR